MPSLSLLKLHLFKHSRSTLSPSIHAHLKHLRVALVLLVGLLLVACDSSNDYTYEASVVRTEYGIPHVVAKDWGSLGYGYGYAYAQDNYCVVMKEVVRANGQSARYLGEDANVDEDFVFTYYNTDAVIQADWIDGQPQYMQNAFGGYVAGFNRYFQETGRANLAEGEEGCRNAEWAREITVLDLAKLLRKTILRASTQPLADLIVAAQPPAVTASVTPSITPPITPRADVSAEQLAAIDFSTMREAMGMPTPEQLGSNAYAIGANASQNSSGLLLGNPHFPWMGPNRFYMSHLTIPGEYDVMGAALAGMPLVVIGFNEQLAWSHTVSTGQRFTFYELALNPANPLQYEYDGEMRDLEATTVSIEQMEDDGSISTLTHTFYNSTFGPVVDLGGISGLIGGWPIALSGTVFAVKDANLNNARGLQTWANMGRSQTLGELIDALKNIGIPWVNTIASSRAGDAFYGDISVVPNVSEALQAQCVRGTLAGLLTAEGFTTLDGSDSDCEWGSDADTVAGVFGFDNLPSLETRDYAANSNDSYWLSNADQLLTGFAPIIGAEEVVQSLRTRLGFTQVQERIAGTDSLGEAGFNIDNLREIMFGNRNIAAELTLSDFVALCSAENNWASFDTGDPAAVAQACSILSEWEGRFDNDSVGPAIFFEFWRTARDIDTLWVTPFNSTDPVNTPNTLNSGDSDTAAALKQSLATAVDVLLAAGIPLDRPWGEVQFSERNGVRIPIHGGSGAFLFSVITSDLVDGEGYSDIAHGNSYIQTVTWDETDCPDAYAIITYSQSTDPSSPHYADMTQLYSDKEWVDMPFCTDDRDSVELSRISLRE